MRNLSIRLAALALALALGIVGGAFGQTAPPSKRRLTLNEAIQIALQRQPDLASARAQASAADQQHRQAKAAYLPTVTLGLTTNDSYSSNTGNGAQGNSGLGSGISSVTATRQADVVVSYKLLDSGQRAATEQAARAGSRAATLTAEEQRQATIANAATSYFELLRQTALVGVQEANVKRTQATLDLTKAQVNEGVQAKRDVYQAQADFETAKVELLTAQNNLEISRAQLKQALGIDGEGEIEASENPTGTVVSTDASKPLAALLQEAYESRPDVRRARQNVEQQKANVRLAKANNGITLSLDTNLSSVFWQNQSNSRAVGLTASLPLFNGGANRAAIRQAEENQRAVEAQLASAKLAARLDVETAYRTLQTAQAAIPAARAAQEAAQINYDAASESLKEGIGTIVDVITAQSQLVEAQTNYVQALYTLYSADTALQRATGHADLIAGVAR